MTIIPAAGYFSDAARTNGEAKAGLDDILAVIREQLGGAAETELTIAVGVVTPTGAWHSIDTEADAATDDLTNIDQTNHPDGRMLLIRSAANGRTVVVKHAALGAGQVLLADSANFALDSTSKWLLLARFGATWIEVLRSHGSDKLAARAFLGATATGEALITAASVAAARTALAVASTSEIQNQTNVYAADTGAANAYAIALTPAPTAYAAGQRFAFKAVNANTGASTLKVGALVVKTIKKGGGGADLAGGDIVAGQIVEVEYDGANFQAVSPLAKAPALTASFTSAEQTITAAGSLTIAHGLTVVPTLIQARIICKVAAQGYAIGDEVVIYANAGVNANEGIAIWPDATNLNVRFGSNVQVFSISNKTTGAQVLITLASWKLIVRAWA